MLLVLLATSLWSWRQAPKMLPTRANCAVHGVHLGYDEAQVLQVVGKPDDVESYYPKMREDVTVWTWGKSKPPDLPMLQVIFEKSLVCSVWGTSLAVGSKDYQLDAGRPLSSVEFLGRPFRSEQTHWLEDTTWKFPEVTITVLSQGVVSQVRIDLPRD